LKPYYQQDGQTIFFGDCREVIDQWEGLRTQSFDLLLTDPPYGHGERWSGGTWASNPMYDDAKEWDAETIPDGDLINLLRFAPSQIVWGGNYYRMPPSRCWLAWVKSSPMDTMADFELAWTNFEQPAKLFRENRNPDGKRWHPTQKPESVMRWALLQAPESVKTVLDPFMGSGTTLVACKRLGRSCVGIEREERYCEIAARRLQQGALTAMYDVEPEAAAAARQAHQRAEGHQRERTEPA
jgi:DNA modification methylase